MNKVRVRRWTYRVIYVVGYAWEDCLVKQKTAPAPIRNRSHLETRLVASFKSPPAKTGSGIATLPPSPPAAGWTGLLLPRRARGRPPTPSIWWSICRRGTCLLFIA